VPPEHRNYSIIKKYVIYHRVEKKQKMRLIPP
jgi:hypothetical protein